ncbi:MAG: STAS domain-containing protein [Sedimentisphaerales bacterium]|nr:STAS domain-containing protein [Sedimentisphaerales bacterium]
METPFAPSFSANLQDINEKNITITPPNSSLDDTVSESFKQKAMQALGRRGHADITIDMEQVTSVDYSGLGCLLYILRQVTAIGGEARLKGVCENVRRQLATARIERLFKIVGAGPEGDSIEECDSVVAAGAY